MQFQEPDHPPSQQRRNWIARWSVLALLIVFLISGIAGVGFWGLRCLRDLRLQRMQREPPIEVVVTYPNATSELVENTITVPLEMQLSGMSEIDRYRCDSLFGVCKVTLYLQPGEDRETVLTLIRNRVALAQPIFPSGAGQPNITSANRDEEPAVWVLLSEGRSLEKTAEAAESEVKPRLAALPGVSSVRFSWLPQGEPLLGPSLYIDINRAKLRKLQIPLEDVYKALKGKFKSAGEKPPSSAEKTKEEIGNQVLVTSNRETVRLKDVVEIKDITTIHCRTRIDGKPVIAIGLWAEPETKAADFIQMVKDAFPQIRPHLPEGVQMELVPGAGQN